MLEYDIRELAKADGGKYSVSDIASAYKFCETMSKSHYENFPVASILIPKNKQKHIFAVYCFARVADDIADEIDNIDEKRELLSNYRNLIDQNKNSNNRSNPIFMALEQSTNELGLSRDNFYNLLDAFSQDIDFVEPETWQDNLDYCAKSANPVGRLILEIFELKDDKLFELSDNICTGLQLVNFWQDMSVDIKKGRSYVPKSLLGKYDCESIYDLSDSEGIKKILDELYEFTDQQFLIGSKLIKHLKPYRLKLEIAITLNGGRQILKKVKEQKGKVLDNRVKLNKFDYLSIIYKSLL